MPFALGFFPIAKAGAQTTVYQIDCAGSGIGSWSADEYYNGGGTATYSNAISTANVTNPAPESVYQSQRYGYMTYTIPEQPASAAFGNVLIQALPAPLPQIMFLGQDVSQTTQTVYVGQQIAPTVSTSNLPAG